MRFSQLLVTCDDGPHTLSITRPLAIPVSNRKFSSTRSGSGGGSTISVSGQFSANGGSASGTIRDFGTIMGVTGCDTGTLSWSAT